jgi:hypothetical protein
MTEKKAMDQTIGQVLHGQVVMTGAEEEKIGFLENHIENLGRSFAALGSNYLVVKNMESVLEKQLTAINRAVRSLTGDRDIMDGPLAEFGQWIRKKADKCKNAAEELAMSRDNAKAAAEMVQTQVSLARTREEVALQNQMQSMLRQNEYFQHRNKKTSTRLILSGLAMFTVFAGMVAASLIY